MGAFEVIVQTMTDMGFRLFLPWLLVLSVTYGLLEQYELVSEETQVNGSIALAMAFLAIIGINQYAPAGIFTNFAAAVAFGLFGLLGFMVLLAVTGRDLGDYAEGGMAAWIAVTIFLVSFITIIVTFIDIEGIVGPNANVFQDIILPILLLIFFILIVRETTGE